MMMFVRFLERSVIVSKDDTASDVFHGTEYYPNRECIFTVCTYFSWGSISFFLWYLCLVSNILQTALRVKGEPGTFSPAIFTYIKYVPGTVGE